MGQEASLEDWLNLTDLSAIPDLDDKVRECQFFFDLAAIETDRNQFRWLVSAFLNAAYSYFESSALAAFVRFAEPDSGMPLEDSESVATLRRYVKVTQKSENPYYVKTKGLVPITERLYELRRKNTHHYPLSIMIAGQSLPEDFHFGNMIGRGTPVLTFCREVLDLINQVQRELDL